MSTAICLAPARTLAYPQGGGHLWVYLQWALGLRALGCRVIWLEGIDPRDPEHDRREKVATLKGRLKPYGLAQSVALFSLNDEPLPRDLAELALDLDAAAEADLLLNLWHSLPAFVVSRFRRSAFVDTDPGLLQIWMTRGDVRVAPHHIYFTIGETVGTPAARFPDCGLRWHYTPPPVFLPEWPPIPVDPTAPYTTVAHWWGSTFEFRGQTINEEKYVSFLEYKDLPSRTPVRLELAVCLVEHYEHWRTRLEPLGWKIRQAWEVSATPEQYRAYIQRSRGEFSCAKPVCMTLANAWISDRTLCYLASGKPAVVQHTGKSRLLPDAKGLFRFRNLDEAARALSAVESDYEHHSRLARALAEEFDSRHVVARVLEQAMAGADWSEEAAGKGDTLMKWLIITGDDFGMSPGINLGIIEAHHCGMLTSASLLVNRPASEAAAALARECPVLSLGLHLELATDDPERVHAQIERQVARFLELVGALPTHLDSHHNVHHDPQVLPHVLAWARRSAVPVRGHSEIRHVSKFYGQWGGDTHLEQIGVEGLLRVLDEEVRDGVTELACHPGYVEAGFRSSYAAEREVELRTLCDERVLQAIRQREIELIGFRDLPGLAKSGLSHPGDRAPRWREVLGR